MSGFRANPERINVEADLWEEQSAVGTAVAVAAEGLRMSYLQAGIFILVVETNNDVCTLVESAGIRAAQQMTAAATALRENAKAYRDADEEVEITVPRGY